MDNYKIKVKDEAESKEAQELLKQLGFQEEGFTDIGLPCYLATWDGGYADYYFGSLSEGRKREELTLPQLRDLVVLKRNDVKDSNCTYRLAAEEKNYEGYLDSNDWMHIFTDGGWQMYVPVVNEELKAFYLNSNAKDPALISGAEAHKALLAGENVQYSGYGEQYWDTALNCNIGVFLNHEKFPDFKFRIVPRTIKLELELPKPFEPKDGEKYWIISDDYENGYTSSTYPRVTIGAWKTEEEIKQVVEQLRKIRGTNS